MLKGLNPFLVFVFSLFLVGGSMAYAEESKGVLARIQQIETKLAKIETDQKLLLQKQEDILKKLDTVKIWARRS